MSCPACKAPLPTGSRSCRFCRVALRWDASGPTIVHPDLRASALICSIDLRRDTLPGEQARVSLETLTVERTSLGAKVWLGADRARTFPLWGVRLRDQSVRTRWTAHGAGVYGGVVARREPIGKAYTTYAFQVRPDDRTFRLVRTRGGSVVECTPIVDWTPSAAVAPTGSPNELVLAARGGSLQGWVNGVGVTAVHDQSFGIGTPGLIFETSRAPAAGGTATFEGLEVCMVDT